MEVEIRKGNIDDLPQVHALIMELAEFERAPLEVTNTLEDMERDGFGENPIYKIFVAESAEGIVGIALYYIAYSTWKGRTIYLEDLVVTERLRRAGIGRKLFKAVAQEAKELGARRFRWQVLEWNEPAIAFYKNIGADLDAEWINCTLTEEQIKNFEG
ncbi:GNAT family N-acetyltransferase [Pontibacter diazotrophicus]|uniref:GNAT family N-acetyltransferase n=1 Tax=Pontibacter diazotrophicus TaxID=1400979 RepID=A0A3D8L5B9_9BACT|nr:GNAT family N-acetyltransferase [Pontibacter diazotrophicus]RDV12547.1 GNAT family N-acetyltransferase [Pontibacter diazotrophicus]